jgi:tetratricopeptide (TPR) repeat protein
MQAALATSLASVIVTAAASASAHARRGAVLWRAAAWLVPGLLLGAWLGGRFATAIDGRSLRWFVVGYCLLAARNSRSTCRARAKARRRAATAGRLVAAGGVIGAVSALVGIGGGSMTVPLLVWRGVAPVQAVATSSACGVAIGLSAAASYATRPARWACRGQPGLRVPAGGARHGADLAADGAAGRAHRAPRRRPRAQAHLRRLPGGDGAAADALSGGAAPLESRRSPAGQRMSIPTTAEADWLLAQQAFQAGRLQAAREAGERVVALEPTHSGAQLLLSNLASSEGRHRDATRHALAAAQRMGRQPLTHVAAVALKLISVGEYEAAATLARKVDPARVPAPSSLAEFSQQLSLLEQHDDALRYLETAMRLGLDGDWVHYIHGNYLKFVGRMDEALAAYERSLAMNPQQALSHYAIATTAGKQGRGERIDRLGVAIARAGAGFRDLPYLHYALFRELDAAGDTAAAWPALEAGFRGKRRQISHDASEETAIFDELIARTPPGFVAPAQAAAGPVPVFVVGMPRTGTTLLERILGGHPGITLCGELNDFRMQYKWASDYFCLGFFDRRAVQLLDEVDYAQVGNRYLEHVAWRAPGSAHFTDKNPGNFMMAGPILRALPQARLLHLRRAPMDACFSNLKELFGSNAHPYSYDFAELATHYRNYDRLMQHWHQIAPGRILDVHYEDMVSDPATSTRA